MNGAILVRPEDETSVVIRPAKYLGGSFGAYTRAVAGARFDGERKCYVADVTKLPPILGRLRDAGFEVDASDAVRAMLFEHADAVDASVESAQARLAVVEGRLREQGKGLALYPFQREGIVWLASRHAALLADEMGLGKTVQTLAALPDGAPVVVVCPAVVKGVWAREAARWRPDYRVATLAGRGSFRWPEPGEIVVTNYDVLPDAAWLDQHDAAPSGLVLVADEAHALKSSKSQRTARFRALSKAARGRRGRVYLLTATPLLNRPQELWSLLEAGDLAREAYGSWKAFVSTFRGHVGNWGGYAWGVPDQDASEKLRRVALRRDRVTVLPDLPTKTWREVVVPIDRKTRVLCDKVDLSALDAVVGENAQGRKTLVFEQISAARAALAACKGAQLEALVDEYEAQDEPLVVFSAHRAPIDAFGKRDGWAVITGDTPADERTRIEESFQRGELRGVACTIQAGGVGITLTRAHHVVFLDRAWTPALNAQAEDRVCRIGQTRGVLVTILVGDHVLDERLAMLLRTKDQIIGASVARAEVEHAAEFTRIDVDELLPVREPEAGEPALARDERRTRSGKIVRAARTAREAWALEALRTLAGLDEDHAARRNGMGFNRIDNEAGHSLVAAASAFDMLTDPQWRLAVTIATNYPRQVGRPESDA